MVNPASKHPAGIGGKNWASNLGCMLQKEVSRKGGIRRTPSKVVSTFCFWPAAIGEEQKVFNNL